MRPTIAYVSPPSLSAPVQMSSPLSHPVKALEFTSGRRSTEPLWIVIFAGLAKWQVGQAQGEWYCQEKVVTADRPRRTRWDVTDAVSCLTAARTGDLPSPSRRRRLALDKTR